MGHKLRHMFALTFNFVKYVLHNPQLLWVNLSDYS